MDSSLTFIIDIEANEGMSFEEKLSSFLKTGSDWGRMKTSVPGIFVLKIPAYKSSPARLAIELNPTDDSGSPTKKRGLVLRSLEELEEYKAIFQHEKLCRSSSGRRRQPAQAEEGVEGRGRSPGHLADSPDRVMELRCKKMKKHIAVTSPILSSTRNGGGREYQRTIAEAADDRNTLVVLPTALGKTVISALVVADVLYDYRDKRVLVMAPTRPLCMQHMATFRGSSGCPRTTSCS